MIEYECPECGEPMESLPDRRGEEEVCPECGESVVVPHEEDDEAILANDKAIVAVDKGSAIPSHHSHDAGSSTVSNWATLRRYTSGIQAYWFYWLALWGAVTMALGVTFSPPHVDQLVEQDLIESAIESIWHYGWSDHYIWFLITFITSIALCSGLSGAIAKKHGSIIATIGNLPIAALMAGIAYFHYVGATTAASPIAWGIILTLAAVGSVIIAFIGGNAGEETQRTKFRENTVLGVHPLHWLWMWLVMGSYAIGLSGAMARLLTVAWWYVDTSIVGCLLYILVLAPVLVLAFGYPVYLMYRILCGDILAKESLVIKIPAFVGVCILGLASGLGADYLCGRLLGWIVKLLGWVFG